MPMKPRKGESQSEFTSRCVPEMIGTGKDKRPQEQAVAICLDIWRNKDKEKQIEPEPGESREDFMDRCIDETGDENICSLIWDEETNGYEEEGADGLVHKTHAESVSGMEFVLSDETPDRMDDIIMSDGWDLANFKKNPIALFNHNPNFVIGKWSNLRVDPKVKQLRGNLILAPEGTSPRIDEIRALIEADILKAVSVGFRPVKRQSRHEEDKFGIGGSIFTKSELVETSLVAVPANPNALAIAKSLKISPATIDLVFAGQGAKGRIEKRGLTGGQAETRKSKKGGAAMSLAQRITDAQTRLVALRDQLSEHLKNIDDSNVTDEQLQVTQELNAKIAQEEKGLAALQEAERHLAETSDDGKSKSLVVHTQRDVLKPTNSGSAIRPFNIAKARKEVNIIDLLARTGAIMMVAHQQHKPVEDIRKAIYPEDEPTRAMLEWAQRAATAPATTTTTGWAAELVQTLYANFMETLMPKAVYPRLSAKGLSLSFGRNGRISIPTRSLTPTIAGSFVGEGQPIPVRQGAFTSQVLTPKKMAVITSWTREIDEQSVPAIEGLLRNAIQEDTAVSLDTVLLDTNAATTVRPAGILNGVTPLTATAGGGFTALVGDIKLITGALLSNTRGNVRSPAWIMNPQQVMSAGLTQAPSTGVFPFQDQINNGNLQGWPIIDSGTVTAGTVIAIDAADFVSVGGDAPRFEISDQATLVFDDTAPANIGSAGTPNVVGAPAKSMWQTDSLALRLILPINWTVRRAGIVQVINNVTW